MRKNEIENNANTFVSFQLYKGFVVIIHLRLKKLYEK